MLKWRLILLIVFTALTIKTNAQNYPQNYFRYPLDSLPSLVSPFGGLRDNHFHSGMDLRTNQREGLPVFASADGYVSRIKIQSIGYGKAIYLEHRNEFNTVYGNLL
jgi:murein DD-endopeptidase MepM/ murein hydrolase activator NlpD